MESDANELDNIDPDVNHFDSNNVEFKAYDVDEFTKCIFHKDNFNIFHHNARSIMKEGRMEDYEALFGPNGNPFQVMLFSETWLTNNTTDLCRFNGYEAVHLLRPVDNKFDFKSKGGGVSIFVKEGIKYNRKDSLTIMSELAECLFIEIIQGNKKYLLGGIYRIPKTNVSQFCSVINGILEPFDRSH